MQMIMGNLNPDVPYQNTVALVTKNENLAKVFVESSNNNLKFKSISSVIARNKFDKDEIAGILNLSLKNNRIFGKFTFKDCLPGKISDELNTRIDGVQNALNITEIGLSNTQKKTLKTKANIKTTSIKTEDIEDWQTYTVFGIATLIFFIVLMFSTLIAQEIATEKGTKIMEILLSSISAKTHFYGKLAGTILLFLNYIMVNAVLIICVLIFFANSPLIPDFLRTIPFGKIFTGSFLNIIPLTLLTLLLFLFLAALCGSLVSQPEDAPRATQPLSLLITPGFVIAMACVNSPNSILVKVGSFLPFTSVFLLPIRIIKGAVSIPEIILSLGILTIFLFIVLKFSEKMYKNNLLMYNNNNLLTNLKQSFKKLSFKKLD